MSYNNESRITKSKDNKKRIIDAALSLINEKGYDNVSVNEITNRAGVSKGAFYIHFKSKEDLIEQQITLFYDEYKLDKSHSKYERLSFFILASIKRIKEVGLKMCQEWFSSSVKGSFFGKSKLSYDKQAIEEIVEDEALSNEIVTVYYGALNMWCFTDGELSPEEIVINYLNSIKEKIN